MDATIENGGSSVNRRLISAAFALVMAWSCPARAEVGKQPTHFIGGEKNPTLLAAIQKEVSPEVTFNGHFSLAFVACGPGCGSYWFVDRDTGGVIEVPPSQVEGDMIWDVRGQLNQDTIAVTYGPGDGVPETCFAVHFRLVGHMFVPLDKRSSVSCPS